MGKKELIQSAVTLAVGSITESQLESIGKTKEEIRKIKDYNKYIWQYLSYKKAKDLGIVFGINDLTPDEIEIFHILSKSGIGLKEQG